MNHTRCRILLIIFICTPFIAIKSQNPGVLVGSSFLATRSQNTNIARHLVGTVRFTHQPDEGLHSYWSATGQYGKSFRAYRIAEYFFGTDHVIVSGSQVPNRNDTDLLADYFGLSPLFSSMVTFDPRIRNGLIDFNGYIAYDRWYGYIFMPYVWCKTNFFIMEQRTTNGISEPFPALYMDTPAVPPVAESFAGALAGTLPFGQVEGARFSRVVPEQKRNGLADVQLLVGYNVVQDELSHFGFNLQLTIPTGNRSEALFLLEPLIGNSRHWEFGGGLTGHWIIWEDEAYRHIGIYAWAQFTHLFASLQYRSFDLGRQFMGVGNPQFLSRYMLAKEFDEQGEYTGRTTPLVNVTTIPVHSSFGLQFDGAIMAAFTSDWYDIQAGYAAWVRTRENVCPLKTIPEGHYGIKGIQNVAGADIQNTQSRATIFGNEFADQATVADDPSPIFIQSDALNILSGAATSAFTQTFFWHCSWSLPTPYGYGIMAAPFIGAGSFVEFEGLNPRSLTEPNNNSISQWGVWLKTGIEF